MIVRYRPQWKMSVVFNMGLLKIVLFVALCASAIAEVARISTCPDVPADGCVVSEARISPCKKSPCTLTKGKNASLSFDFTPNFVAEKMKTKVYWASAVDVPFEGFGSDDACTYTTCPSQPGQAQTLDYHLHVSKMLPQGMFNLKWKVWNEDDASQVCCFMTRIKLVKK